MRKGVNNNNNNNNTSYNNDATSATLNGTHIGTHCTLYVIAGLENDILYIPMYMFRLGGAKGRYVSLPKGRCYVSIF